MNLSCPKCNKQLPEVETLQFRFCPHCGAEIAAKLQQLDEAYLTIPPDSPPPNVDRGPDELNPETEKKLNGAGQFNDQTVEPQAITPQNRPQIKPPADPPPSSFFRTPPAAPEKPPRILKKQRVTELDPSPPLQKKEPPTKNHSKVIIAVLILLAVVILILGGLFTF